MHRGSLTISRPQCSDGRKYISIEVKDECAGIRFLEIEIDYADFAACLTGLAYQPCDFRVRCLENVGKVREMDTLIVEVGNIPFSKSELQDKVRALVDKAMPAGWKTDYYIESRDSFFTKNDKNFVKLYIYRWVTKEEK